MGAKILPCTCTHADQDRMYGKGRRVFTIGSKDNTCTVCLKKR